jgi:hypothetical protein
MGKQLREYNSLEKWKDSCFLDGIVIFQAKPER